MSNQRESVIFTAMRRFITAIFTVIGIGVGILLFFLLLGGFSLFKDSSLSTTYEPSVLYNTTRTKAEFESTDPTILVIDLKGVVGLYKIKTDKMRLQLLDSHNGKLKDTPIKGVLLHINSPGGTVTDADGIYNAIKQYKELYNVPVYAFVDGLCASGGMYIACAADKIYATDASLIGSVGVILNSVLNFSELINTIGIKALTLSAGKGKDDLNPLRPWKEGEEKPYQEIVDYYYKKFVEIVVKNRHNMTQEKLVNEYGAHVYPAPEALSRGYIDAIQNDYFVVLGDLVKQVGLEGKTYQVIEMDDNNWFKDFLEQKTGSMSGTLKHEISMPTGYDVELMNKPLYLYRQE
jgi:signal peptide peptidase SppA